MSSAWSKIKKMRVIKYVALLDIVSNVSISCGVSVAYIITISWLRIFSFVKSFFIVFHNKNWELLIHLQVIWCDHFDSTVVHSCHYLLGSICIPHMIYVDKIFIMPQSKVGKEYFHSYISNKRFLCSYFIALSGMN